MNQSFFGTDGIRASVGMEPLTAESLVKLGRAIGQWMVLKKPHARIVIASDTRLSASLCTSALKTGLLLFPVSVDDAHVAPTPLIYHALKDAQYDFGIVVTASHNAFQDNGIKIITDQGKITLEDEKSIMIFFYQPYVSNYQELGSEKSVTSLPQLYLERLDRYFSSHFLRNCVVVVDTAHGAFSAYAEKIFAHYGATVKIIHNTPDGKNINKACGSLHPQVLQDAVIRMRADIGFAFDGDGDRVVVVTADGVVKDGDDILCFLLKHPRYKTISRVVGTIISNEGLSQQLLATHRSLVRTPVGDKYVLEMLKKECLILGGEPSGHIIMRDFSECSDGLFTALRIAETTILIHDWNLTTFTKYPHISKNMRVVVKEDLEKEPFVTIIKESEKSFVGGRLIVRYSGTEPLLRIVAEGPDKEDAEKIVEELTMQLQKHFSKGIV